MLHQEKSGNPGETIECASPARHSFADCTFGNNINSGEEFEFQKW
jgi:hypothetical protein